MPSNRFDTSTHTIEEIDDWGLEMEDRDNVYVTHNGATWDVMQIDNRGWYDGQLFYRADLIEGIDGCIYTSPSFGNTITDSIPTI